MNQGISNLSLSQVVRGFSGKRIVVVGDLVLDHYLLTHPQRISREAPVLILEHEGDSYLLGGGANALHNILSLGGTPIPVGLVGNDEGGATMLSILRKKGVDTSCLLQVDGWTTPVKTRVMSGGKNVARQQVVRIDRGNSKVPEDTWLRDLADRLVETASGADAVLISDYGYGITTGAVMDTVMKLTDTTLVTVDSRKRILEFKGATIATPNEPEAAEALGVAQVTDENIEECGRALLDATGDRAILLTRGQKGMVLFTKGAASLRIPIYGSDEVADVTGAGDTVIATLTLALAAGADFATAARLSNYAGGMVVMKLGTATVSQDELLGAVES